MFEARDTQVDLSTSHDLVLPSFKDTDGSAVLPVEREGCTGSRAIRVVAFSF